MTLFDVYPLFDVNIVKGKGCHVWDEIGLLFKLGNQYTAERPCRKAWSYVWLR